MDNFSDKNEEEKNEQPSNEKPDASKEGSDIEFDETIDIDELQKTLIEQMKKEDEDLINNNENPQKSSEGNSVEGNLSENNNDDDKNSLSPQIPKEIKDLPALENSSAPESKKYVVYIDPENVPFMEDLSIHDRKLIINKILKEQDNKIKLQKQREARKRYTIHVIVAVVTTIVAIPLLLYIVNRAVNISVANYRNSRQSFEQLYREHGKIKPSFPVLPKQPKI